MGICFPLVMSAGFAGMDADQLENNFRFWIRSLLFWDFPYEKLLEILFWKLTKSKGKNIPAISVCLICMMCSEICYSFLPVWKCSKAKLNFSGYTEYY